MDLYRIAQIILLLAALTLGISAVAFNGMTLLALLLVGLVPIVENHRVAAKTVRPAEDEKLAA